MRQNWGSGNVALWGKNFYAPLRPSSPIGGAVSFWTMPSGRTINGSETSVGTSLNEVYYGPTFLCDNDFLISEVRVESLSAIASHQARLGLVEIDPADDQPLALIADWGTVDTSSLGFKTVSSLSTRLFGGKRYATVLARNNAGGGSGNFRSFPSTEGMMGMSAVTTNRPLVARYEVDGNQFTNGFSSPPPDWDTVVTAGNNTSFGSNEMFQFIRSAP
jgi:hypothetical protein